MLIHLIVRCKITLFGVKLPFSLHNEASIRVSMMVDQFGPVFSVFLNSGAFRGLSGVGVQEFQVYILLRILGQNGNLLRVERECTFRL